LKKGFFKTAGIIFISIVFLMELKTN